MEIETEVEEKMTEVRSTTMYIVYYSLTSTAAQRKEISDPMGRIILIANSVCGVRKSTHPVGPIQLFIRSDVPFRFAPVSDYVVCRRFVTPPRLLQQIL